MTKGLLISFAGYPYELTSFMPDNGLANLAGALIANGHEIKIIDYGTTELIRDLVPPEYSKRLAKIYNFFSIKKEKKSLVDLLLAKRIGLELKLLDKLLEKKEKENNYFIANDLIKIIAKEKPSYVGFKLWLGDCLDSSIEIAKIIKKNYPNLKIYGGGPLIDVTKELFYKKTTIFDAVAYGEGEETIVDLADHSIGKKKLAVIPNIIYKDGNKIVKTKLERITDLNDLPFPIYNEEIYPSLADNSKKFRFFIIDESRGCPNHCGFCAHRDKSGNFWRTKSPARIVDEIEKFIKIYKSNIFRYGGSNPPFDLMVKVASEIISRGLKVRYSSFGHVNNFDTTKIKLLKDSGLSALSFGIESGDQRILNDIILKGTHSKEAKDVLKKVISGGIFAISSIIFPCPTETEESKNNTLNFLLDVYKNNPEEGDVQVFFPGLYPNSIWGRDPEKYDFKMEGSIEDYIMKYMDYKIKRLFPPSFWEPLPYTISGKSFKEFSKETGDFIKELEKNNILTMVSDEIALMSQLYNPGPSLKSFRDINRRLLFSGDYEEIKKIIYTINKNIETGINSSKSFL